MTRTYLYPPAPSLAHLEQLTDDVGVMQHATHDVPNRNEGYCLDDNARALLALTYLEECGLRMGETDRPQSIYASFVNAAWNGERRRFRNFMGFDRRWLDDEGSEDAQGRALHALARARRYGTTPGRRAWADWLFHEAAPSAADYQSPRAVAHVVNALVEFDGAAPGRADILALLRARADYLRSLLHATASPDWFWFEETLAYENALLPAALIAGAHALGDVAMREDGLAALRWIDSLQTADEGWFRPVGTKSFGTRKSLPQRFDQQPIEAFATIMACRVAAQTVGDGVFAARAAIIYEWFLGRNDVGAALYNEDTGDCCDGLHPDRANQNKGAEACLSALMSAAIVSQMRAVAAKPGISRDARTASG